MRDKEQSIPPTLVPEEKSTHLPQTTHTNTTSPSMEPVRNRVLKLLVIKISYLVQLSSVSSLSLLIHQQTMRAVEHTAECYEDYWTILTSHSSSISSSSLVAFSVSLWWVEAKLGFQPGPRRSHPPRTNRLGFCNLFTESKLLQILALAQKPL